MCPQLRCFVKHRVFTPCLAGSVIFKAWTQGLRTFLAIAYSLWDRWVQVTDTHPDLVSKWYSARSRRVIRWIGSRRNMPEKVSMEVLISRWWQIYFYDINGWEVVVYWNLYNPLDRMYSTSRLYRSHLGLHCPFISSPECKTDNSPSSTMKVQNVTSLNFIHTLSAWS